MVKFLSAVARFFWFMATKPKPEESIVETQELSTDELCYCLHCKLNALVIMLNAAYHNGLERDHTSESAEKLTARINGEFKNFRNN